MVKGLVSINEVIRRVINNLGISDLEITTDDYIDWIADGLKHIGSYYQFEKKQATIEIDFFKGELPCDHYKTLRILNEKTNYYLDDNNNLIGNDKKTINNNSYGKRDMTTNFNTITTSFENGKLDIQYLAIPLDCDGFPLIPDNIDFMDALMWKCTYQLSMKGYKFKQPAFNDFRFVREMWQRYCAQARASANMPDVDTIERLKNIMVRMKPELNAWRTNFAQLGKAEGKTWNGRNFY